MFYLQIQGRLEALRPRANSQFARRRRAHGSGLVETTIFIALLTPGIFLLVDGSLFFEAILLNDTASKRACRAASSSAPDAIAPGQALKKATEAISQFRKDCPLVNVSSTVDFAEELQQPLPNPTFGGPVRGNVTITTTTNVLLPFYCSLLHRIPVTVKSTKTFPYTWILPPRSDNGLNSRQ